MAAARPTLKRPWLALGEPILTQCELIGFEKAGSSHFV